MSQISLDIFYQTFYPMGEERAVVRECLGIELEPSQLPSAAKSVVINSETCSRVAEAVDERKPSFLKHLTVRGKLNGGHDAHVFMDVQLEQALVL